MSEPRKQAGPRTFSLITIVQWIWLVGLSVLIVIGWRPSSTDAGSEMWEAVTAHLKAFETRISALEESNQARLVQAPSATQQALQGLRETLEARLERLEQPAGEDTFSVALDSAAQRSRNAQGAVDCAEVGGGIAAQDEQNGQARASGSRQGRTAAVPGPGN
ncbi:hypothetical protein P4050_35800 [Pseudomonas aeruginosa]|nr:hypothetical protein [Pseudomonas aeruginosa]